MNIETKKTLTMRCILCLLCCCTMVATVNAQRKITFVASDKLIVTADLYQLDKSYPYIILLHQENSSRGEYKEIAPKLQKLGFNCLAVDLRSGKESNFVQNETVLQAQNNKISATAIDCEKDILAAIDYIGKISFKNKCIVFGSSFSASLAIKAAQNKQVAAVIAFSPGEYFAPAYMIKDWTTDFNKLIFVAATKREYPFVTELLRDIPQEKITLFQPSSENGVHGAPALWKESPASNEYWMSLMMFIKKVKEVKNLL